MRVSAIQLRLSYPLALLVMFGCSGEVGDVANGSVPDLSAKVPVGGVVTIQGKPVAKVTVTFLPQQGGSGVGETDENGKYSLQSYSTPGLLPGEYKVAISYLVSVDGEPQDMAARASWVQPPGMATATERVPTQFSDLGRTKLTASVSRENNTLDFDVSDPLLPPPVKKPDGEEAANPPGEKKPEVKADATPPGELKPEVKADASPPAEPKGE